MKNYLQISWKTETIPFLVIAFMFVASIIFYNSFPETVPVHWNLAGQADGWSGRTFGAFFIPCLTVGLYALFLFIPNIDPNKENFKIFAKQYHYFKSGLLVFMAAMYLITGLNGMDIRVPIDFYMPFLIGVGIMLMGLTLSKVKQNYTFGIRLPWTLANANNWDRTHKFGGKMFFLGGLLLAISGFFKGTPTKIIMFAAFILLMVTTCFYSYYIYLKGNKK
ncbi:MAG: SdpI family protein [Patescibacteria group bacterium]|nr:SdpI family protein [Patescibacteria group bacterium]